MRKFLDNGRVELGKGDGRDEGTIAGADDVSLRLAVKEEIARTPGIDPDAVAVSVDDAEVLLRGDVASERLRRSVHGRVARLPGVRVVHDQLNAVEPLTGDAPPRPRTVTNATFPSLATDAEAELGQNEQPASSGPSPWWIALAVVLAVLAFWLVSAFF